MSIEDELKALGVLPKVATKKPEPKQERLPERDTSWFARGEECPH